MAIGLIATAAFLYFTLGMATSFVVKEGVYYKRLEDNAKAAVTTTVALWWPLLVLWGVLWCLWRAPTGMRYLGKGFLILGRGYTELYRSAWPARPKLPRAVARQLEAK